MSTKRRSLESPRPLSQHSLFCSLFDLRAVCWLYLLLITRDDVPVAGLKRPENVRSGAHARLSAISTSASRTPRQHLIRVHKYERRIFTITASILAVATRYSNGKEEQTKDYGYNFVSKHFRSAARPM